MAEEIEHGKEMGWNICGRGVMTMDFWSSPSGFFDHFVLVCGKCEYDTVVRDGDPVGIAAKIVKDLFGASERFFERFWRSFMVLGP